MLDMRCKLFLLLSLSQLMALAAAAPAPGDCRAAVRPLLLQNPPPAEGLRQVRELCEAAMRAGEPDAEYQMAMLHLGPIDWDVDAAVPMIKSAAASGVAEAQYWLAWQYEEGPLLPNDSGLALQWYRAAGENEHQLALARLATAYQNGELGLEVDAKKATEMRAKAEACANRDG